MKRQLRKLTRNLKKTFSKKKNRRLIARIAVFTLVIVLLYTIAGLIDSNRTQHDYYEQVLHDRRIKREALQKELTNTQHQKATTETQLKQKAQHEQELEQQIDDLNAKLQAKLERQSTIAKVAHAVTHTATAYAASAPSGNYAMDYIFAHESGNVLDKWNSEGCLGLGQACPGSKLIAVCPNYAVDRACQVRFFTDYANSRYGGWGGAYQFWLANHWW